MNTPNMNRRHFLYTALLSTLGFPCLPSFGKSATGVAMNGDPGDQDTRAFYIIDGWVLTGGDINASGRRERV
ncbi:MAG: hypothetical protein RPU32_13015 [Candidatus Sedimenticola sp. (ex Thyasira tokunagai)]